MHALLSDNGDAARGETRQRLSWPISDLTRALSGLVRDRLRSPPVRANRSCKCEALASIRQNVMRTSFSDLFTRFFERVKPFLPVHLTEGLFIVEKVNAAQIKTPACQDVMSFSSDRRVTAGEESQACSSACQSPTTRPSSMRTVPEATRARASG